MHCLPLPSLPWPTAAIDSDASHLGHSVSLYRERGRKAKGRQVDLDQIATAVLLVPAGELCFSRRCRLCLTLFSAASARGLPASRSTCAGFAQESSAHAASRRETEAAECPPPSREAFALGSGAGWLRPHHLPQVESVELVSRFWRRARPAVFEGLPFSAVLWLPEGVHSRPSRDPGGGPPGGGQARPLRLRRKS